VHELLRLSLFLTAKNFKAIVAGAGWALLCLQPQFCLV
jgi:hypothetical protein